MDQRMDGQTNGQTDGPTKWGVELLSTQLKTYLNLLKPKLLLKNNSKISSLDQLSQYTIE